jgi:hypothetical protein
MTTAQKRWVPAHICLQEEDTPCQTAPYPLQSTNTTMVERGNDDHQRIIIVQFQALVCYYDPMTDDCCPFHSVIMLDNGIGHEVGQVFREC